jgi:hypothetical protein
MRKLKDKIMKIKIKHNDTLIEIETMDSALASSNNEYIMKIIKETIAEIIKLKQ